MSLFSKRVFVIIITMQNEVYILGIDTSCDDTSASVVKNSSEILSNIVSSQSELHSKYGGIVPELASRRHIELIWSVVNKALADAGVGLEGLSAIAVCYGPGLIGSLLVGTSFAKSICYSRNIPLIGINHLEGHVFASFLCEPAPDFPFLSLVISGGHTALYRINEFSDYVELGRTRDDAVGEAYDKVAKMLDLGYPGGPVIDRMAKRGNAESINFPRPYLPGSLDFSFSGLKTAVRNFLAELSIAHGSVSNKRTDNAGYSTGDICASFQKSVVDVLVRKAEWAIKKEKVKTLTISGGVASNNELRDKMKEMCDSKNVKLFVPPPFLCTDNAAMIASAGHFHFEKERFSDIRLNPKAYLPL